MSESEAKVLKMQAAIFAKMTPSRRLEIAGDLYETARALKTSWLRKEHGDWTEERIQATVRRIFSTGYAGA